MKKRTACLGCGCKTFISFLNLGKQSITDFPTAEAVSSGYQVPKSPLELALCASCNLVQLLHPVPREAFYGWYGYRSGGNQSMRDSLKDLWVDIVKRIELRGGDTVIDIGSNDGTFLKYYNQHDISAADAGVKVRTVGFEPAKNLQSIGAEGITNLVAEPFSFKAFKGLGLKRAKIITATAMFYDLEDPMQFLDDCFGALADDGILVIQQNYLLDMLNNGAYDNVSHEHVAYYSLTTLKGLIEDAGLRVFKIERNDVNGGSFRVYCSHLGARKIYGSVLAMLSAEMRAGLNKLQTYHSFSIRCSELATDLHNTIRKRWASGESIYVYGASTRGLVVVTFANIAQYIKGAAERNPEKIGRMYSDTGIKCVSEQEARAKADTLLVLPYQFIDEFVKREADFIVKGGTMIIPIPSIKVWSRN